jgi:prepilin-type N-terminal cleavage/methylation domain
MKIPILLKVLQISKTSNPQFPTSRKGDEGFSLLEMMMIVLIIGILTSIAVPGWLAFINNQRLRASLGRVSAVMQLAQSNAKRDKIAWQASFRQKDGFVQVALHRADVTDADLAKFTEAPINTASENTWIKLEQSIELSQATPNPTTFEKVTVGSIDVYKAIFNRQGCLVQDKTFECTDNPPGFTIPKQVTLNIKDQNPATQKCVIVETVLGAMRTDEGAACK